MLKIGEELYCGVFDSRILRKNQGASPDRTVRYYELELFHEEGGVSYVSGEGYAIRRGMLLVAKPGQLRHTAFPMRCSFIRVLPGEHLDGEVAALLHALPDVSYLGESEAVEELWGLFSRLGSYCAAGEDTARVVRANGIFLEILYRILRLCEGEGLETAPVDPVVQHAMEYISEHYKESCSLTELAATLNLSPNYLHAVFKRATGQTPYAVVTARRIEQAQRLIAAGNKSMLEIALELGFCSQSHFNKVFKKETGMTPAEYRRGMLERY